MAKSKSSSSGSGGDTPRRKTRRGSAVPPVPPPPSSPEPTPAPAPEPEPGSELERLRQSVERARAHLQKQEEQLAVLEAAAALAATPPATPAPTPAPVLTPTLRRAGARGGMRAGVFSPGASPAAGAVAFTEGAAAAAPAEPDRRTFAGFLTEMGEAYAAAQNALDRQSAAYLASGPQAMPSLYRIPSLKAEMKCAMEAKSGSGLNLLFYQSTASQTALHQQSLSFEIVAAPPPPGLLAAAAAPEVVLGPRWEWVVSRATRQAVLGLSGDPGPLPSALGIPAGGYAAAKSRILLWELLPAAARRQPTDDALYIAGYTGSGPALAVLAVRTTGGAPALASAVALFQPGLPGGGNVAMQQLQAFLTAAGDWQRDLEQA